MHVDALYLVKVRGILVPEFDIIVTNPRNNPVGVEIPVFAFETYPITFRKPRDNFILLDEYQSPLRITFPQGNQHK